MEVFGSCDFEDLFSEGFVHDFFGLFFKFGFHRFGFEFELFLGEEFFVALIVEGGFFSGCALFSLVGFRLGVFSVEFFLLVFLKFDCFEFLDFLFEPSLDFGDFLFDRILGVSRGHVIEEGFLS